jgi:hypothetical protein
VFGWTHELVLLFPKESQRMWILALHPHHQIKCKTQLLLLLQAHQSTWSNI